VPIYEELIVTGAWWDFVDEVAVRLLAELLASEGAALAPVLRAWATDDEMWKRRAAIVCQVLRKRDTDLALLYDCIEANGATASSSFASASDGPYARTPGSTRMRSSATARRTS
jgi:3-methyladenine DNA glycosylase AlkD